MDSLALTAKYRSALDSFVERLKADREVVACILFGSLSYDQVWRKSDIDLFLVVRDGRKVPEHMDLVEDGINLSVQIHTRSKFKRALEGALQSSFMHSAFSRSTILFTKDESLRDYYVDAMETGSRDRDAGYLLYATGALHSLAKAEKWCYVRKDVEYALTWILRLAEALAAIEVLMAGQVVMREVLQQAISLNPGFFRSVYTDLIHGVKDIPAMEEALDRVNRYLSEKPFIFKPVLDYLKDAGAMRTVTDMEEDFRRRFPGVHWGCSFVMVCDFLEDMGLVDKMSKERRLTDHSTSWVEEASYSLREDTAI